MALARLTGHVMRLLETRTIAHWSIVQSIDCGSCRVLRHKSFVPIQESFACPESSQKKRALSAPELTHRMLVANLSFVVRKMDMRTCCNQGVADLLAVGDSAHDGC